LGLTQTLATWLSFATNGRLAERPFAGLALREREGLVSRRLKPFSAQIMSTRRSITLIATEETVCSREQSHLRAKISTSNSEPSSENALTGVKSFVSPTGIRCNSRSLARKTANGCQWSSKRQNAISRKRSQVSK